MIFSNPRRSAVIEDWPSGSRRVTATFEVEKGKAGERVVRTTTGKPHKTTYNRKMVIADGDDGRTYLLAICADYDFVKVIPGTMKHDKCLSPGHIGYDEIKALVEGTPE